MHKGSDMESKAILDQVRENLDSIMSQDSEMARALWEQFTQLHPADIADFISDLPRHDFKELFERLHGELKIDVFEDLSDSMRLYSLSFMPDEERIEVLNKVHADQLTDLFDLLPEDELKKYLGLLRKDLQHRVLSLLKFHPESAGGIMNTEVFSLMENVTVEKSVNMLKQLSSSREIYRQIYVTDRTHRLVGYVQLEDLLMQDPDARIGAFMRENALIIQVTEDRESVSKKMVHYGLAVAPVVDESLHFLGIIPSLTLIDVLMEEASEDVQKMSALAPMKESYFETSFPQLLYERTRILVALLLAGSFSTTIMRSYESTLHVGFLLYFASMLISTGGNTSNQTSAMVIQGLALGDIQPSNVSRFLKRELLMACVIALILALTGFARAYLTTYDVQQSLIVSLALFCIVIVSVIFGSCIPLLLRRLNIDPAFSAGPFLATLMDILGVLIFCTVAKCMLGV